MKSLYEVIVGNVGTIYDGGSYREALKRFKTYVEISKSGSGRAGNEDVTLMRDGEIIKEHFGTQENPSSVRAQVRRLPSGQVQIKVPLRRGENPMAKAQQLARVLGRKVTSVSTTTGGRMRSLPLSKARRKR